MIALVLVAAGCDIITNNFTVVNYAGDQFPDAVDLSTGAIVVGVLDGSNDYTGVVDIMSPVSIEDSGLASEPEVTMPTIYLLGADAAGALTVPRAEFDEQQLIEMHPCDVASCTVGDAAATRLYTALLGGDTFSSNALRLDLGSGEIFVLDDIPGDEAQRTEVCDAVFPTPFRGGGTLIIDGTELDFGSYRPALETCFAFDPAAPLQAERGADALLVASTSVGPTLLAESAYERYRDEQLLATGVEPPDYPTLPAGTVTLPGGPVDGFVTTIPSLALVASSTTSPRSPCRQDYASHLLAVADCPDDPTFDCPCGSAGTFCTVPGVTELTPPAGIDVLIISDDEPVLQALRTELSPDQANVDGILGTQAMLGPEIDADYPNNRMLMRCAEGAVGCSVRPELDNQGFRPQLLGCAGQEPEGGSGSGSGVFE